MTYIYSWLSFLIGTAFFQGCLLGAMMPPALHPPKISLVDAHLIAEAIDESIEPVSANRSAEVRSLIPEAASQAESRRDLPLAA